MADYAPLVEIELIVWPKTGMAKASLKKIEAKKCLHINVPGA